MTSTKVQTSRIGNRLTQRTIVVLCGLMCVTAASLNGQMAQTTQLFGAYDGLVVPSKQVVLNAPLDAILHAVYTEENESVSKGQMLAQMDDRLQQVVVELAALAAQSDAEIRRMRFARDEAKILLERATEAHEADAASEWEVRRARLQLDQAIAAVDAGLEAKQMAAVELKREQQRLEQFKLFSPFDGRVIRIAAEAEAGATLTQDDPVLTLAALDPLEARINLSAQVYGRLRVDETYELQAGEPVNGKLHGRLKTIDPVIDSASQTFRCVFVIDNPDAKLPAGFSVWLPSLDPMKQ